MHSFETIFREFILILKFPYEIAKASVRNAVLWMLTLEALGIILGLGFLSGHQLLEEGGKKSLYPPNKIFFYT